MSILEKKQAIVNEIAEKYENSASSVVVEYRGLTVAQVTDLRNSLRAEDIEYKVYKNTMARLAAEKAGYSGMVEHLIGPNAFAFGPDAVAPSRILSEFAKKHKRLKFKTGVVNGNILDVPQLQKLSQLPNKDGMLSILIGMLQSPVRSFAAIVKAVGEAKDTVEVVTETEETVEAEAVETVETETVETETAETVEIEEA